MDKWTYAKIQQRLVDLNEISMYNVLIIEQDYDNGSDETSKLRQPIREKVPRLKVLFGGNGRKPPPSQSV
jgi:hypothetical protein